MPMSEPESTSVEARAARQTARNGSPNQVRIGTRTAPTLVSPSPRRGGSTTQSSTPPSTPSIWVAKSTHDVDHCAAAHTARAGAIMNDSSTAAESSEMAVRRSASPTDAMTACRVIEKVGMTNSPATTASTSSGQYPTNGAMLQQTSATHSEGSTTRRSPSRSSSRPRHGPLTAMATVAAADSAPAAA